MCLEHKLLCILQLRGEFNIFHGFPWISMDLAPRGLLVTQLVKLCLHGRVKVRELGVKGHQRTGHREHCTENEGERWEMVD